jgi:broad specificity phosphatase PhoE
MRLHQPKGMARVKAIWKNIKELWHFGKESPLHKTLTFLVFFALLGMIARADEPVLFIVRHAEKAATGGNDPDLSDTGRARAESLAKMLKDAKITAIYTTELKRTQQTAAPLSHMLDLQAIVVPASETASLVEKLKAHSGNALVVGHGNTIPDLLKALGLTDPISIAENDYDNLFVVIPGSPPRLIRLHFS